MNALRRARQPPSGTFQASKLQPAAVGDSPSRPESGRQSPLLRIILCTRQGWRCSGTPPCRPSHPCGEKWPTLGHFFARDLAKIPQILPLPPPAVFVSPSSLKRKHLPSPPVFRCVCCSQPAVLVFLFFAAQVSLRPDVFSSSGFGPRHRCLSPALLSETTIFPRIEQRR